MIVIRISVAGLSPGMTTARNIYGTNGNLLVAHDVILNEQLITRLQNFDIDSIYVKHPHLDIEVEEVLREKTRVETIKQVSKAFENFAKTQSINIAGINLVTKKIVEEAVGNRKMLIHLADIRSHDDYTFGHSVNVCLLSVMLGLKMRLPERQLNELALGAILHDLGKMLVPKEILNKPGPLSAEELSIIRTHSEKGFNILRAKDAIPLTAAHVAFQHHENFDGTGYPRGVAGEEIHKYARMVALADLYDAVTSDRPYRLGFLPHEAYELILMSRGAKVDPAIADVFLENIAFYPVGSTVMLDTGETGVVIQAYSGLQTRPVVRVITGANGKPINGPAKIVDLAQELTRFIVRVLQPEEIFQQPSGGTV